MAGPVYWLGANGHVYLNGVDKGTPAAGANSLQNVGADTTSGSFEATRINDPNPPKAAPQAAPTNPNGASTVAAKPDKSNDIALNNAGLSSVDSQTAAGLAAVDKALGLLKGQYNDEATANEKTYTDSSNTNTGNLQTNKQSAYVNAAQGRQGLFGKLASLGALNGSGIVLANNAVQTGANEDLSGAAQNFATNQSNLDTSIGTFRRENKARNDNADLSAGNAKINVNNDAARSKQNFYKALANDYDAEGDTGNANKYSGLAGSLYPAIASSNVPNANVGYSAANFQAPSLSSYLAGANGTAVTATGSTPGAPGVPGLVATSDKKKLTA